MDRTCFGLSTEETYSKRVEDKATDIGIVAYMCGKRPSELFEWNNPDEWFERLLFDIEVCGMAYKALVEMKHQFP